MSKYYSLLLVMALLIGFSTPVSAKPIILKFSHVVDRDTPKGKTAEFFKTRLEEESQGRISVKIYPNATLYDDQSALKVLRLNAIQLAAPSFSKVTILTPELQLFDLPFLFHDVEHLHHVLDGEVGQELLAKASKNGLRGLGFWDNGFKQISANRPILLPEDATGLNFRIMSSKVLEAQFRTLGANTQVLPFADVYAALQQGIVSGQENTLSNIYTKRFHLVQSDLTLTNHGYLGYLLLTNDIFWEKLSVDLQQILTKVSAETTDYAREISAQVNTDDLAKIRTSGKITIHTLTDEQRAIWQERMRAIYPEFYPIVSEQLIDKVRQ